MKQSRTVSFSDPGKRVVSFLLMLAMILTMVPHTTMAAADTTSEEGVAVVIDLSEVSDVPMYLFNYLQENGITESDVTVLTLKGGSVHSTDLSFLTVTLNKVKILDLSETSIDLVPQGAILNKASLVEIRLPDSVTAIDSYAFFGCSNLESIRWPQNLETIGSQAFQA